MARTLDVCIRGAGITGRALALLLGRERLRVGLLESSHPNPHAGLSDVRAYALNQASKTLLESLRCWPDATYVTPVHTMQVFGDGRGQLTFDAHSEGSEALTWIVEVAALEDRLAQALTYQPQIEILQTPQAARLTVVCEGRASVTRSEFGVEFDVTPYHQQAIAARVTRQQPHGQTARQWFTEQGILALLPLGGEHGKEMAMVWSLDAQRAQELRDLPESDFLLQLQAACMDSGSDWSLSGRRASWPLQLARARRWTGENAEGAWALAGDAAHTVHPLAGQGLNLGLADVAELASTLRGRDYWREAGDARLLRRYERARKADVWAMGCATDGLQQLFTQNHPAWKQLRNWGLSRFDSSGPLKSWFARRAMN